MSIKQYAVMAYYRSVALEDILIKSGSIKEGELQKLTDEIMAKGREETRKAQEDFWNSIKIGSEIEFIPVFKKWNTMVKGMVISKSDEPFKAITFQVSFSQAAKYHKKDKIYCETVFNPEQIRVNTGWNCWKVPPSNKIISD